MAKKQSTKKQSNIKASVDAGNGGVNADVNGKTFYFPSARARATGSTLGLGDWEMQYKWADWRGHRFIYGDDVVRVSRKMLEHHIGGNRYGNEMHQFLVAVALGELGVKNGDSVDLTVFAPPGLYAAAKKRMTEAFQADDGIAAIQFKNDKQPRAWHYNSVTVWPECFAAAAAMMLNDKGEFTSEGEEMFQEENVVIDVGVHTIDSLLFTGGEFNPEALNHATFQGQGLDVHVRQPLVEFVKGKGRDFSQVTVDDIDILFRSESKVLTRGGSEIDLAKELAKQYVRYAEWIANTIIDERYNGLNGVKNCIITGGPAIEIARILTDWYGDKIFDRKKSKIKHHPSFDNAIGGRRMALATED